MKLKIDQFINTRAFNRDRNSRIEHLIDREENDRIFFHHQLNDNLRDEIADDE